MKCRHCGKDLEHVFLDLGFAPPSNAYLTEQQLNTPEVTLPLRLFVCDGCWLVQTEDFSRPEDLFDFNYAYYSSTSKTWLAHAQDYVQKMTVLFGLDVSSFVVEIASNDGYLLRNFLVPGIPCLGIEPTKGTADVAERLGIPVLKEFFNSELARKLAANKRADLIIGNNVYAHVPDINDFTLGMRELLNVNGVITLEFPHLLELVGNNQFDTVYHEHFSYLSLYTVSRIFQQAGLRIWHVEQLTTHGGSLRVYGCHAADARKDTSAAAAILLAEKNAGLRRLDTYRDFQARAETIKFDLLSFLLEQKRAGKTVAAYGAAAKGNTLLNYAGIKPDMLPYVCDAAPSKQGKFLPGSHIPILPPDVLIERRPDYVLIMPWNISAEVREQNAAVGAWGGKFVTAIPRLEISG